MPEFPEILKLLHEHGSELANVEAYREPETHPKRLATELEGLRTMPGYSFNTTQH